MKRLTIIQPLLCSLLRILQLSLIVSGQSVLAQEFDDIKQTVSLASYFSSGDYGEDANTNILYFPVSYSVNKGKWLAQLSVPHLHVEGIGNVLVNIGGVSRAVAGSEQQSNGGTARAVRRAGRAAGELARFICFPSTEDFHG